MASLIMIVQVIVTDHIPIFNKWGSIFHPDLLAVGIIHIYDRTTLRHLFAESLPKSCIVLIIQALKERTKCSADQSCAVHISHCFCQHSRNLISSSHTALFGQLITNGPEENRRMIAVASYHSLDFFDTILCKLMTEIETILRQIPNIKSFIKDNHSQFITDI